MCDGTTENKPTEEHSEERAFGQALFRVMHSVFMEHKPSPVLDMLPLAQLRLLWAVYYHAEGTMKDFSERLHVSQSTVTQLADRLVRRGMVERHADPNDRRMVRLRVSDITQGVLDEVDSSRRSLEEELWQAFSPNERSDIMRVLGLIGQEAEKIQVRQGRGRPAFAQSPAEGSTSSSLPEHAQPQPVLDLMNRRVRGVSSQG